jgi:hydroxyacylglutathione hydrolase
MELHSFVFNPFYENTYLLFDNTGQCVIIDPGCYETYEKNELVAFITDHSLTPVSVVNTHCHIDHVLGNAFCKRQFDIPLQVPLGEKVVLDSVPTYSSNYGFQQYDPAEVDEWLPESGTVNFGETELKILFAPGHAPGHLMYYHEKSQLLIAGDVIFRDSIGRTDLPGGDFATLEKSIREQVYSLPKNVTIFPGHGPSTTVEYEMSNNPFVKPL